MRSRATSTSASRASPSTGSCRPAPRPGRGAGAEPAQGGSARLRALEGEEAGRGHVVGLAVGSGPARAGTSSARRWRRSSSGRSSRSTAAGSTSSSRTTRTSSRSRVRSATGSRGSGCTTGCSEFDGEKMSKSLGNVVTLRDALDAWGRETLLLFFMTGHWRKPIDFSDETLAAARAQAFATASARRWCCRSERGRGWERLVERARRRLQHAGCAGPLPRLGGARRASCSRAGSTLFGLESLAERRGAAGVVELAEQRERARAREGLGRGRRAARPRSRTPVGRSATSGRDGSGPAVTVTRELVYGRRAVREALRGRREVLELLRDRAGRARAWLRSGSAKIVPERELTELAGTRDHQGVVARVEPYRVRRRIRARVAGEPLLVCLDQVTDPRNLGAVCRSRRRRGGDRRRSLPAHSSARVTPAVCALVRGRGGAPAGRGRPRTSSRFLNEVKGPRLWVWAADATGTPMGEADLSGGLALVFGAEGKGLRPRVRRPATGGLDPARRRGRVAERQCRGGGLCSTRPAAAALAEPTLYLFDGFNLLHAGDYRGVEQLVDELASFVALQGRARSRRLRRARPGRAARAAGSALRAGRRHADRAAGRRAPRSRVGLPRLLRPDDPRDVGPRGAEALLEDLPPRPGRSEPAGASAGPARGPARRRNALAARASATEAKKTSERTFCK